MKQQLISFFVKVLQKLILLFNQKERSGLTDGYHSFSELYDFRLVYNASLFNEWARDYMRINEIIKKREIYLKILIFSQEIIFQFLLLSQQSMMFINLGNIMTEKIVLEEVGSLL